MSHPWKCRALAAAAWHGPRLPAWPITPWTALLAAGLTMSPAAAVAAASEPALSKAAALKPSGVPAAVSAQTEATSSAVLPDDGASAAAAKDGAWSHAYAAFGAPKYPRGFSHFEYVSPEAPKGGTLYLANSDRRTSFDKFNPFTIKGNAPAGIAIYMLETLATLSADEPQTMYGLLAAEMQVAPDKSAITFRLHPQARFSNGEAVTSEDVKFSFDTLTGKYVSPGYNTAYAGVARAVVLDATTIRFELAEKNSDTLLSLGGLPVFSRKWGLGADGKRKRFDEVVTEHPLTTGAYTIAVADSGRRIEFRRNPGYWAAGLGVRRGFYNFDRVVYRYYKDEDVATEAFKAGEYDIVKVYSESMWARQYRGEKFQHGRIVKLSVPLGTGQGLQSYQLNQRRPILQDIRVREALGLTYDFETNNRYRRLVRASSVFNNSDFAAQGLPSAGELKLLEPYRRELPAAVFGPPYVAPRTDTDPNALRHNLLKARGLLEAAGWKLAADGVLRNAKGEAFEIEYLAPSGQNIDARMNPWRRNLEKLGMTIRSRSVDFALFGRRLDEYDFDMVTIVEGAFTLPSVATYLSLYGSKSADEKGGGNYRGVKSAAVDHVLAAMGRAATLDEFRDACRALDRIVMWSHWQVPELYSGLENMAYWNKFGMPAVRPKYFTTNLSPEIDPQLPWPIVTWWLKDAAARVPGPAPKR